MLRILRFVSFELIEFSRPKIKLMEHQRVSIWTFLTDRMGLFLFEKNMVCANMSWLGVWQSGQLHLTVNQAALRLRRFESSRPHN